MAVRLVTGFFLWGLLAAATGYSQTTESNGHSRSEPGKSATLATRWPRVKMPDPILANVVRGALDQASRLLEKESCRGLLLEFHDGRGAALAENLAALEVDVQTYLSWLYIADGSGQGLCAKGAVAYTAPGSRVLLLCLRRLETSWLQNPRHVAATFIHEMLHSLGLGENPPSSSEITARILKRCKAE